ncbi:MAG: micrococcal nuclease [Psychromonas sp.]|uniref:thermonuclease family protein n=1 Tax=Psychromonas sp. TaxID=1884585 RepID=UPI0039E323DC
MRIFSFLLCVFFSTSLLADCPEFSWHKTVTLKYINDGDTVTLDNGQLVRFIGINAPEIDHSNKSQSQPFALAAKRLLEKQMKIGDKLHLIFDQTRFDKYGRLLAYVFSQTGGNLGLLQLKSGLARHWVIGHNDLFWRCFQDAERQARVTKKGLWADFRPLKAQGLSLKDKGYQYIIGEITGIKHSNKGLQLTLDGKLQVNINRKTLSYFKTPDTQFGLHNSILLTGNLKWSKGQLQLSIYHPAQILP